MSIVYYPGRIYKKAIPAIDRVMAKRSPITVSGSANIAGSNSLSEVISANDSWQLDSVLFKFNSAVARDFGFSILNGRKVVEHYNDYLWFHVYGTLPQKITLSADFYSGTELAAQLQTQLNANTAYIAAGITFTVTYDNVTGLFVITPSSSTIKYLNVNMAGTISNCDSIAGHLFGLTADSSSFASNVTSDTAVTGLDDETNVLYYTSSAATAYFHDTTHTLSIDQAIHLKSSNTAAVIIDWTVLYEELI